MDHVIEKLVEYRVLAQKHTAPVKATATATLRAAANAEEFVQRIQDEAQIEVQVISGFREASLVYAGVRHGLPDLEEQGLLCVDVGGGSTELASGSADRAQFLTSIAVGTLVVHRRWLGFEEISSNEVKRARKGLIKRLKPHALFAVKNPMTHHVCTGGSAQRIAKIARIIEGKPDAEIHGYPLSTACLDAVIARVVGARTSEGRKAIPGMDPERANQLLGGAIIYRELSRLMALEQWTVSMSAIRTGMILELDEQVNG